MYKQVFDYNGNPYLVKADEDGELSQEDLKKQGLYQYTEIMPPSNLYPPRTFDGSEWHGSTAEEYENNNKPPVIMPDEIQMIIANLQLQLVYSQSEIKNLNKRYEELKEEVNKNKGSVD